ncbi:hypothetical protein, partial [Streptomyces sp. A012304]|uniref:hypothetical protein n=1 Tax=Streptomyces sp. A012304 TaxID=375446 RepID=UPI002232056F
MPEHLSMTQLAGGAVLVLACGAWLVGLTRALRRSRPGAGYVVSGRRPHSLSALPNQRPPAPALETVEL